MCLLWVPTGEDPKQLNSAFKLKTTRIIIVGQFQNVTHQLSLFHIPFHLIYNAGSNFYCVFSRGIKDSPQKTIRYHFLRYLIVETYRRISVPGADRSRAAIKQITRSTAKAINKPYRGRDNPFVYLHFTIHSGHKSGYTWSRLREGARFRTMVTFGVAKNGRFAWEDT